MVSIDQTWDRLKKVRSAAWKAPADHADLDPPHEALQLMEHFREAGRLPVVTKQPEEFQRWMGQAERAAQQLETALREKESEAAAKAFDQIGKGCTQCHMKYRDVPKDR
jgi:cytochrome c556